MLADSRDGGGGNCSGCSGYSGEAMTADDDGDGYGGPRWRRRWSNDGVDYGGGVAQRAGQAPDGRARDEMLVSK